MWRRNFLAILLVAFTRVACSSGGASSVRDQTVLVSASEQEVISLLATAKQRFDRVPDVARNDFTIEREAAVVRLSYEPKKSLTSVNGGKNGKGTEDGIFVFEKTADGYACIKSMVFYTPHAPAVSGGTEEEVRMLLSVATESGHTLPMDPGNYNFKLEKSNETILLQCDPKRYVSQIDGKFPLGGRGETTLVFRKAVRGYEYVTSLLPQ